MGKQAFRWWGSLFFFYAKNRNKQVTKKHITMPIQVGIRNPSAVHFRLWVSFFMVRRVVAQGQCIKVKINTDTAVCIVHPFSMRIEWREEIPPGFTRAD